MKNFNKLYKNLNKKNHNKSIFKIFLQFKKIFYFDYLGLGKLF